VGKDSHGGGNDPHDVSLRKIVKILSEYGQLRGRNANWVTPEKTKALPLHICDIRKCIQKFPD
jgi:uncharacterized Fe-S radical SAM superfamily protein PflX